MGRADRGAGAGSPVPEMPFSLGPGSEQALPERCFPVRAKEERREEGPSGQSQGKERWESREH